MKTLYPTLVATLLLSMTVIVSPGSRQQIQWRTR